MHNTKELECQLCGRCCSELGHKIEPREAEVSRWVKEDRMDILKHIDCCNETMNTKWKCYSIVLDNGLLQCSNCEGGEFVNLSMWSERCPFLRKKNNEDLYFCRIHDTKPEQCASWKVGELENCPLHEEWLKTKK